MPAFVTVQLRFVLDKQQGPDVEGRELSARVLEMAERLVLHINHEETFSGNLHRDEIDPDVVETPISTYRVRASVAYAHTEAAQPVALVAK